MEQTIRSAATGCKALLAVLALAFTTMATAQTTPNVPTNTDPGLESTTPPPYPPDGSANKPSQQNSAWKRFNAATDRDLRLNEDQMNRVRDLDSRYERQYRELGPDPLNAPGYRGLYDQRDGEIRGVLTPEQYEMWNTPTTPVFGEGVTPPY